MSAPSAKTGQMKLTVAGFAGALVFGATPLAYAAPPNFPDLTDFTVVTDSHLSQFERGIQQVLTFSTAGGVHCRISALDGVGPATRCYGPTIEGVPVVADGTAATSCDFGVAQLHSVNSGVLNSYRGECPTDLAGAPLLGPGQKVRLATTVCGAAPGNVTACIDSTTGGHGFVLQPAGSWVF